MTPDWFPKQNESHDKLLDLAHESLAQEQFDAIVVPTNRRVERLDFCIRLAREADIPLIVLCSKRVTKEQVLQAAAAKNIEAYAIDLALESANFLKGITFQTSENRELLALTSGRTRDLSTKRNIGLVIAKMLGWQRLMFLDDDIYGISREHVDALAAGLNDHNVSVLIPDEFPDNSVACHAYRLSGGKQGKFASGGAMGLRCDRDDLPFFPNIYNEDWFFFADDAARHAITDVGTSKQREYDPYEDPERAVKEEFGDLLAEGLYARLDVKLQIPDVDASYWTEFIKSRKEFLDGVADSLARHKEHDSGTGKGPEVRAAEASIQAARGQLESITAELCQQFIDLWQADLVTWRRYLGALPRARSIPDALEALDLIYAGSFPSIR